MKKRLFKLSKFLGATLLEILLVLAIAAMIIIMAVRYYQSTTQAQQANSGMQQLQSIVAASDNIAQMNGKYSTVTSAQLQPLLPSSTGLTTAWGSSVLISSSASSVLITFKNTPAGTCQLFKAKLGASKSFSTATSCGTVAGDLVVSYTANP